MLTDTTEITLVTEAKVAAKQWSPSNGATSINAPMLLASARSDASQWSEFADAASESGDVYAVWDLTPYTLIQTIWAIGEPTSVVAQGKDACDIALRAAKLGKGALRSLVLIDYGLEDNELPSFAVHNLPCCPRPRSPKRCCNARTNRQGPGGTGEQVQTRRTGKLRRQSARVVSTRFSRHRRMVLERSFQLKSDAQASRLSPLRRIRTRPSSSEPVKTASTPISNAANALVTPIA